MLSIQSVIHQLQCYQIQSVIHQLQCYQIHCYSSTTVLSNTICYSSTSVLSNTLCYSSTSVLSIFIHFSVIHYTLISDSLFEYYRCFTNKTVIAHKKYNPKAGGWEEKKFHCQEQNCMDRKGRNSAGAERDRHQRQKAPAWNGERTVNLNRLNPADTALNHIK